MRRKKIAVDIDGTIAVEREHWWEYELCEPIPEAIAIINQLYDEGYFIIYYTARHEEDLIVTGDWLSKHGAKYHHLVMGKVRADIYIDNASYKVQEVFSNEWYRREGISGDIFGQRSVQREVDRGKKEA